MFKSLSLNLVICMHLFESDIQTDLTHAIISQKIVQSGLRFKPWVFPWRNAQTMLHAFLCRVKREKWIATFGYRHSSEIATRDLGHTLGKCLNRLNNGADFECPRNCPCEAVKNKHQLCGCLVFIQNKTSLNIKAKFKKKTSQLPLIRQIIVIHPVIFRHLNRACRLYESKKQFSGWRWSTLLQLSHRPFIHLHIHMRTKNKNNKTRTSGYKRERERERERESIRR